MPTATRAKGDQAGSGDVCPDCGRHYSTMVCVTTIDSRGDRVEEVVAECLCEHVNPRAVRRKKHEDR